MEVVPFPSPSTTAYLSCPTSPSGVSFMGSPQFFYSAPSSPTRGLTSAVPFKSEAAAAEKAKQGISGSDDFEFEISLELSQRFDVNEKREDQTSQGEEAAPANMAFADELFSNGLVLPLKLPPRLQSPSYGSASRRRSSSSLLLRGGFEKKDDEFDRFEAAPEKLRKEDPEWSPLVGHRRTRSLSPWRDGDGGGFQSKSRRVEAPRPIQKPGPQPATGSSSPVASPEPVTVKPAETKGDVGPEKPVLGKPTISKSEKVKGINGGAGAGKQRRPDGPVRSRSERAGKRSAPPAAEKEETVKAAAKKSLFRKGSKGRMIKDFLFRSASEGRVDGKDKLRVHTAAIQSSQDMSFKSAHGVLYRSSDEARKKTSMAYRPSALFECLRMKDQKKKKKNFRVTGELDA